jgi:hypothetical protein
LVASTAFPQRAPARSKEGGIFQEARATVRRFARMARPHRGGRGCGLRCSGYLPQPDTPDALPILLSGNDNQGLLLHQPTTQPFF